MKELRQLNKDGSILLPEELLRCVFENCDSQDLLRCSWVCRNWRNYLLGAKPLWRRVKCSRKINDYVLAFCCQRSGGTMKELHILDGSGLTSSCFCFIEKFQCFKIEVLSLSRLGITDLTSEDTFPSIASPPTMSLHSGSKSQERVEIQDKHLFTILKECSALNTLYLSHCVYIQGDCFIQHLDHTLHLLQTPPPLSVLILEHLNNLSDEALTSAFQLYRATLRRLRITHCRKLTRGLLRNIAMTLTHLESLELSLQNTDPSLSMPHLTFPSVLSDLTSNCTQLRQLQLTQCSFLCPLSLYIILRNSKQLQTLNISDNDGWIDMYLGGYINLCPNLTIFQLSSYPQLSDRELLSVLSNTPNIKTLEIDHNIALTDQLLANLQLSHLNTIFFRCNPHITKKGIDLFLEKHPQVLELFCQGCVNLRKIDVENLNRKHPKVNIIF